MPILEALKQTVMSIKTWVESNFLKKNEIEYPDALPNPHALTFSGAVEGIYDGSHKVEVVIPNPPSNISELTNDSGYLTSVPVQSVNGQTGAVEITTQSIGAQPAGDYVVSTNLGNLALKDTVSQADLASDVQVSLNKADSALQSFTETDPTVPSWAKATNKPTYTASEVGADASGTANSKVSNHNTSTSAHDDIRTSLQTLTSGKVNISDVINNLTTNNTKKPLSAAQGLALKNLIDAITVPTKVSQLTNDQGYITGYTETDPTVPSWAKATSKPSYTKSEIGLGNVENVKQYSANNPPPYPVTSVNSKTGAVAIRELPAVTTADNGKVLMVVNGAWKVVDMNITIDANGIISV